ncbi:Uncharacterized protein EbC_pEb17200220 (plasmid) [Erwinia billingiae Eb661]|uniref:Uncharacterized protein n=1 Tax=Erwinia billingiae (strain Eb661) TaxID=634500 RepID=D8MJM7_ERWBE|nr:hypothetical protein [Erwinia billingiae]CAX53475.1 Uncharacterized protein EbC_pEb17200220 [Erwinia billingiae Eb661]
MRCPGCKEKSLIILPVAEISPAGALRCIIGIVIAGIMSKKFIIRPAFWRALTGQILLPIERQPVSIIRADPVIKMTIKRI